MPTLLRPVRPKLFTATLLSSVVALLVAGGSLFLYLDAVFVLALSLAGALALSAFLQAGIVRPITPISEVAHPGVHARDAALERRVRRRTLQLEDSNARLQANRGHEADTGTLERVRVERRGLPAPAQAERRRQPVLVVDDHPVNRLLFAEQVTVLGYPVEAAADGREALAKWRSGRFSLVITDCNMPGMDGYELTAAIRAAEREEAGGKRTAIIACTAKALEGEAEKCLASGMDDFLAKPVQLGDLLAKLDAWLPAPGREPPVDSAALAASAVRSASVRREAFMRFRESNDAEIDALLGAIDRRDISHVTQSVHRIKGASRSLGAKPLAEVCQRIEFAARSRDWTAIIANRDAFLREVGRLNAYLRTTES